IGSVLLRSSAPLISFASSRAHRHLPSFPTRRSSDLGVSERHQGRDSFLCRLALHRKRFFGPFWSLALHLGDDALRYLFADSLRRSEEHTSELQSRENLVCRLLLEKKKKQNNK